MGENLICLHCMVITLNKMQTESWHRKQITMELISLLTLIDRDWSKNVLSTRVKPNHKIQFHSLNTSLFCMKVNLLFNSNFKKYRLIAIKLSYSSQNIAKHLQINYKANTLIVHSMVQGFGLNF